MDPLTLSISGVVAGLGSFGFVAAVFAWKGVHGEIVTLERGSTYLRQTTRALAEESSSPDNWLHQNGFPVDSHFGDCIMATWGGWLAGRVPTLAELHNLAARRERRRFSARLAGGITGLLVVIGIAGTLSSIHPILSGFNIAMSPTGAVDSSARASQANRLIQDLGSAFFPSLVALGFTVLVAATRGFYSQATSSLALKLDRFAVDFLFPTFRVRTFGEELTTVQRNLSYLAETMLKRDTGLASLVASLQTLTADLTAETQTLKGVGEAVGEASKSLKGDLAHLSTDLGKYLGTNTPLMTGLAHLEVTVKVNQTAADQLAASSLALSKTTEDAGAKVAAACRQVQAAAAEVPESVRIGCLAGSQELLASGRAAAAESARVISTTFQNGSARLQQTIDAANAKLEAGANAAGQVFIGSCATATQEALTSISDRVAPITSVAGEISQANTTLQTEVRSALSAYLNDFHTAGKETLDAVKNESTRTQEDIRTQLGTIVVQLTETERAASEAATMAREVLKPATELLTFFGKPRRWWERMRGKAK